MTKKLPIFPLLLIIIVVVVSGCDRAESVLEGPTTVVDPSVAAVATAVSQPTPPTEPTILIEPETALADEPVAIQVLGLKPEQTITLRASMRDGYSRKWESEATFAVDSTGDVDVTMQAPLSGTYAGVDPMGLIWSMVPKTLGGRSALFVTGENIQVVVTLTAEIDGETIDTAYFRRLRQREDVEMFAVSEDGLVGFFFAPETTEPVPTLLVLSGSDGGVDIPKAAMLASHGYATLALDYFGNEPLPLSLTEVPVEYFATAVTWLKSQDVVDGNKIGVIGTSRGGELALLLGATYPELFEVVVGYVPSGLVIGNFGADSIGETSAWTFAGEPIPFYSEAEDNLEEATISVEKIQGPVLLISGKDDQLWDSTYLADIAINRLVQHNHPYPYEHLAYENAGHWIGVPYWPTTGRDSFTHPVSGDQYSVGGTPAGDALASADSWVRLLEFLASNLAEDDS